MLDRAMRLHRNAQRPTVVVTFLFSALELRRGWCSRAQSGDKVLIQTWWGNDPHALAWAGVGRSLPLSLD